MGGFAINGGGLFFVALVHGRICKFVKVVTQLLRSYANGWIDRARCLSIYSSWTGSGITGSGV